MTIQLSGTTFSGPYFHTRQFDPDFACVYVILNPLNQVVDIGQTNSINNRIISHDRKDCWYTHGCNDQGLYVHISNDENYRIMLERVLREVYMPLCGER